MVLLVCTLHRARWRTFFCALSAAGSLAWAAGEPLPTRLYDVTTEMTLPHLEENLRYSITHEKRCLAEDDLSTVFPVLTHPALASCRLDREDRTESHISYALNCSSGTGTKGHAIWDLGERRLTGTLFVQLGGKNMTFSQRITADAVAECTRR